MDDVSERDLADQMVQAGTLVEAGDWAQAILILKGLLANPELADHGYREWLTAACHLTLGHALERGDDLEGAVACYRSCIEVALDDPEDPDTEHVEAAYSSMGAAFRLRERWAEALFCYQKAFDVEGASYLLPHIQSMEERMKAAPLAERPKNIAPAGFRRLETTGKGKPFWCRGSVAAGVQLRFDRGSAAFGAEAWEALLAHFTGRVDVPLGASFTDPPAGSLGAYLAASGQNLASYLVPILVEEGRVAVRKRGNAVVLDFTAAAATWYAFDVFEAGRLADAGYASRVVFHGSELRYVRHDGREVREPATATSISEIDTRTEPVAGFRLRLDGDRLIVFGRAERPAIETPPGAPTVAAVIRDMVAHAELPASGSDGPIIDFPPIAAAFDRAPDGRLALAEARVAVWALVADSALGEKMAAYLEQVAYRHFLQRHAAASPYRLLGRDGGIEVPLRVHADMLLAETEDLGALQAVQDLNFHRAEWQDAGTPIAAFLEYRGQQTANLMGPPWALVREEQAAPDTERAIAEALSRWFREVSRNDLAEDGTYRGWVTDFGYRIAGRESFGLDLRREDDRWALFVLAVGWSYTGPWENSAAFIGVLAELDLLRHERWVALGVDEVLARARAHLAGKFADQPPRKFPFDWKPGHGGTPRKRVFFPAHWRHGLTRAVERWPRVRVLLEEAMTPDLDAEAFIRAFLESDDLTGLTAMPEKPDRRMRVKVPMLLRELRAQGLSQAAPAFCVIPDMRVKQMRDVLGLPNGTHEVASFFVQMERIAAAYGELYDMPLFAFWDYCAANPASANPDRFVGCQDCPVQAHCATFARRQA